MIEVEKKEALDEDTEDKVPEVSLENQSTRNYL